jgi:hypothetical protein
MNYLLITAESLALMVAILLTLNFIFTTFAYGLALAMGKITKADMGYIPLAVGMAWGLVFFLHSVR